MWHARAGMACLWMGPALAAQLARADVASDMVTQPGASATVQVTLSITTALGSSTDDDTRIVAVTGTSSAAFTPDVSPFAQTQLNELVLDLADTTFVFQLYCIPIFGCQTLNVEVSDLQFMLVEASCAGIAGGGAVTFADAVFHSTGGYAASGVATASGEIDAISPATFAANVNNPDANTVRFNQLNLAAQTFVVPPDQLPSGVTALSFTINTNLSNVSLSGSFAPAVPTFDSDDDGTLNACDCLPDIAPKGGGDNAVNIDDLLAVISAWGSCPGGASCLADIAPVLGGVVGDGVVDIDDLLAVISAWGACR